MSGRTEAAPGRVPMMRETGRERVLVTGGSGFIGTNLVDTLLRQGWSVCNVDIAAPLNQSHAGCWIEQDILDGAELRSVVRAFEPTRIVHLAARTDISARGGIESYAANTVGTENVLGAVAQMEHVRRTIITSSMLVCRSGYIPRSDDDVCPPNLYGQSKVLTETITRGYGLRSPWTIIRPVTIWGPWCHRYREELFRTLSQGRYLHPGGKRVIRTYGYVGNVIHQVMALLHAEEARVHGRTFYVGDPALDLREWVDGFSLLLRGRRAPAAPLPAMKLLAWWGDLLSRAGVRFPLTSGRLRNMTSDNEIDMSSIMQLAGAGPFSMSEGIEATVRWLADEAAGKTA